MTDPCSGHVQGRSQVSLAGCERHAEREATVVEASPYRIADDGLLQGRDGLAHALEFTRVETRPVFAEVHGATADRRRRCWRALGMGSETQRPFAIADDV